MSEILPPLNAQLLHQQIREQSPRNLEIALELMDWVVAHQATGERIASLNKSQQRWASRWDLTGMLYLPSYVWRFK